MGFVNNIIFRFFNIRFDLRKIKRKLCSGLGKFILCKIRDK